MKSKILSSYLKEEPRKWEMAEHIYYYTNRKNLLSETQIQMIQEFLDDDEKNKLIAKDISENFKNLLDYEIEKISMDIISFIELQFNDEIKISKFGGVATHEHYINFDLKNNVRIQFRYSNYPYFNFKSIWVQFYKTGIDENDMKNIIQKIDLINIDSFKWNSIHINQNHQFIDNNNFYNVIFDKNERELLAKKHIVLYELLDRLLKIYSVNLKNELE